MSADVHLDLLSEVRIASPCSAKWQDMAGDERSRLCSQCNLSVHNISNMTRAEANAFLAEKLGSGERVCGRLYRRSDGKILTRDCPVGLAAARKRVLKAASRVAAAVGLASVAAWAAQASESRAENWNQWGWAIEFRTAALPNLLRFGVLRRPVGHVAGMISGPSLSQPPQSTAEEYYGPHWMEH